MVHPQALDHSVPYQLEDLHVGRVEDLRVLHPYADQLRNGEEAAVVELGTGQPPPAEPVPLRVKQLGERQLRRGLTEREALLPVVQYVSFDPHPAQLVADPARQHRQQHLPAARLPVDVEPAGVRRQLPFAQHLPQRRVVLRHGRHMVRDDVQDEPETVFARRTGQPPQTLLAAQLVPYPGGVDDVIAVRRPRYGLQHRRQMQMRDAEPGDVRDRCRGGREREVRLELQPVCGGGRHANVRTQLEGFCVIGPCTGTGRSDYSQGGPLARARRGPARPMRVVLPAAPAVRAAFVDRTGDGPRARGLLSHAVRAAEPVHPIAMTATQAAAAPSDSAPAAAPVLRPPPSAPRPAGPPPCVPCPRPPATVGRGSPAPRSPDRPRWR